VGMAWFIDHRRLLRALALILLVIAFSGPWAFEQINVPMPYECDPPYIRLDEDFCGSPISLAAIISMVVSILPEFIDVVTRGEAIPNLFIFALGLFLAPAVTSLITLKIKAEHSCDILRISIIMQELGWIDE